MGAMTNRARSLVPFAQAFAKSWWNAGARWGGPLVPTSDGMLPMSYPWNYWQCALPGLDPGPNPTVEACISAYARVIGMLPVTHWRTTKDGGRTRVTNSAAARVMRRPNTYQSRPDFFLNLISQELHKGNGYAVAARDGNSDEIMGLHIVPEADARYFIDRATREIYYGIGHNDLLPITPDYIERWDFVVPQRDVLHLRLQCPRDPLEGVSPLVGAALAVSTGNAIAMNQAAFFQNFSKPSGILQTEVQLTPKQMDDLRKAWEDQTRGPNAGGTPILGWGIEYKQTSTNATDAAIIEQYKLSIADIARVFGVPLPIIGELGGATFANTEQLIAYWLSTGLGYMVEHVEQALDWLFRLPANEYMEFDVDYLMRADFLTRVDGYTKGISGGLFAPDEARGKFDLPKVEGGASVRLQAQVVPLENALGTPTPSAPTAPSAPAAATPAANDATNTPEAQAAKAAAADLIARARKGMKP
jgi:HK97 family phage portal protein